MNRVLLCIMDGWGISNGSEKYGADNVLPTKAIFLYAGVVALFVFIPMIALLKKEKKNAK